VHAADRLEAEGKAPVVDYPASELDSIAVRSYIQSASSGPIKKPALQNGGRLSNVA